MSWLKSKQHCLESRNRRHPFIGKVTDSESRSEYYSVVEALWQLDGSHDRKRFLKKVKKLWSEKYSKDSGAREELRQRADPGSSDRQLMRSFVSN